jgi:dipeptidyl aminopeptidase/acylaminoacyl peptidase
MKRWVLVLAAAAAMSGAARAAPLEAYGGLPSVEQVAISPDGEKLALISTDGDQRRIAIQRLSDGKMIDVLGAGDAKVRFLQWAGPNHILLTTSRTATIDNVIAPRSEYYMSFDYDLQTKKMKPLLKIMKEETLNTINGAPEIYDVGGDTVVMVQGIQFVSSRGVNSVFQINLDRNIEKIAATGSMYTNDWTLGADGQPVAQTIYDPQSGRWALRVRQPNGGWKDARVLKSLGETPSMLGLGRDGSSVLVAQSDDDGESEFREVMPDGAWSDPLPIKTADDTIHDPKTHKLIGYQALIGDEQRVTFFDPADQKAWAMVERAYAGKRPRLVSWSEDRRKLVVHIDDPAEGPGYALVDLAAHRADWLGADYQKLGAADIAPVQPLTLKAADGLELHGYLTLPKGRAAKNLPLIVFPHGGPAARDEPSFDWWAQAMASRGYAVLQINYRGSDGYGWKFLSAGFGQWGHKMQTDLSDGVRHLAAEGLIDPKRVCIVGASYGGYAAMAGMTLDPDVYRCGVAVAGISDMQRFIAWAKTQHGVRSQRYWLNFVGAQGVKDSGLAAISPAMHADQAKGPLLLIHGRDDTVVPLAQSREMADAMKAAGKPVDLIVLDSTDHWLSKGATRLVMLQQTMAFVEKNNPPD